MLVVRRGEFGRSTKVQGPCTLPSGAETEVGIASCQWGVVLAAETVIAHCR